MAFLKVDKKLFDHIFWKEARVYSKAEAWLDLINMARFEARQEIIQNKVIEIKRGQIPASRRFLEKRWEWSSSRVTNYLKMLKQLGMINQQTNQGQTILTLVNYGTYNKTQTTKEPQNEPETNQRRTRDEPNIRSKEYKALKENKEEKGKKKSKAFSPPEFEEFKIYAIEKCQEKNLSLDLQKLELKFDSWKEADWVTGKGTPIRNWKSTLLNTLPYIQKEKSSAKKDFSQNVMIN